MTGRRIVGIALCCGLWIALPGDAAADGFPLLRVGTCQRDITPVSPELADEYTAAFGLPAVVNHSDPVWLAGFGNGRAATGYHDRLWARGVVIDRFDTRIAIVALDVVGYFENEIETIRSMVSSSSRVDFVVVSSTHQHEGPDTLGLWGETELSSGIDYAYLDFVNAAVADCIDEAAARLQPALVRYARTTSAGLSLGTDAEDDGFGVGDGKVLAGDADLAPDTEGRIVDPRLSVMQFTRLLFPFPVIATVVNFASHPESLGSNNRLVTADFPHFARERLEQIFGGQAIWISGALGVLQGPLDIDVLDPETGAPAPRRTFRFAEVHGHELATRAASAVRRFLPGTPIPQIEFASAAPVPVRLDNPFFRFFIAAGVLNVRRSLYTDGQPDPSIGFPFPPPFDPIPQALGDGIHTATGVLRVGQGWFAVVPTELDPQIGERYRARMSAGNAGRHTFIVGLGNDHIGYQVPFEKWDPSCHVCAPFILAGVPQLCPVQPFDCNTVFANNVGQEVDPSVTNALEPLVDSLQ
jgi:hypothetical protein